MAQVRKRDTCVVLSSTFMFEIKWENVGNAISRDFLTIRTWFARVVVGFWFLVLFCFLLALSVCLFLSLLHKLPGDVSMKCPQTS